MSLPLKTNVPALIREIRAILHLVLSCLTNVLRHIIQVPRQCLFITAPWIFPSAAADDGLLKPGPGPGPAGAGEGIPYEGSTPFLTAADYYRGNAQSQFFVAKWIKRGIDLRQSNDVQCYDSLIATLASLINIRAAEYSGSAGVLSLLPTIGALLGAPTNEIWHLWTVVPFGGFLTMLLSFGGAILPIKIEDYERDLNKGNGLIGSIVSFRAPMPGEAVQDLEAKVQQLGEKLRKRMGQKVPRDTFNGTLTFGFCGMIALLIGAHGAMGMVEQGGILPWWCSSRWWMHLWYILVTITAIAENWSNLPFDQQWSLFVSDVPYRVEILDGDDIMNQLSTHEVSVRQSLNRLSRLRAGRVIFKGSKVKTQAVNTVIIMVSMVAKEKPLSSVLRLFTKMSSIGVFVTGTAFFASVQLLALPMAVMVLTFILAAGVFGRGFANWIVSRIDREEPLIHIIVKDPGEAHQVISRILELNPHSAEHESAEMGTKESRLVQVEIGGHVFINKRRVGSRSSWHVRMRGIMTAPFDLRKVAEHHYEYNDTGYDSGRHHMGKSATSYTSPSPVSNYQTLPMNPALGHMGLMGHMGSMGPTGPMGPTNNGPNTPMNHGLNPPMNHGPISPLNHGSTSPLNHGTNPPLNHGPISPLDHGPVSPLNQTPTHQGDAPVV